MELTESERLAKLESACRKLWPSIQFFGLCGAAPQYIEATMEIGRLIGTVNDEQVAASKDSLAAARQESVEIIAQHIESSVEINREFGRKLATKVAEQVRNLQIQ